MNDSILQRDHKTVRGTIRYTSKKPERLDEIRGRERYEIYCSMCHGTSGRGGNGPDGSGLVGRHWQPAPPNFHFNPKTGADNRVPMMPDGEVFEAISTGNGKTMPAYAARLSVEDRWAIVHYVRALQSLSK